MSLLDQIANEKVWVCSCQMGGARPVDVERIRASTAESPYVVRCDCCGGSLGFYCEGDLIRVFESAPHK